MQGRAKTARGTSFESAIKSWLETHFQRVEAHKRVEGFGGVRWNVDFLVDSCLVLEASVQRRLETKINSTFLRFVDIVRKHPEFKAALILEKLHVGMHKSLGKKYFPTSEYRTMIAHGFPIVSLDDMSKL